MKYETIQKSSFHTPGTGANEAQIANRYLFELKSRISASSVMKDDQANDSAALQF